MSYWFEDGSAAAGAPLPLEASADDACALSAAFLLFNGPDKASNGSFGLFLRLW